MNRNLSERTDTDEQAKEHDVARPAGHTPAMRGSGQGPAQEDGRYDPVDRYTVAGRAQGAQTITTDERLNHRLEVTSGVLEESCRKQLQQFFARRRQENKDVRFSDGSLTNGA